MAPAVRAVLWDMDGTLIDSQPFWDEAFTRHCTARGGTVTPQLVSALAGTSIPVARGIIAATGAAASPQDPAALEVYEAMARDVEARVAARPPLLPGAREITSAVARAGLVQAIVSASPRVIVERVAAELGGVSGAAVFATLVCGDDGVGAKPDPLPYATAVERLGVTPHECVVVEDSPTGAASARGNGIRVVQVGSSKHFPADPGLVAVPDLASVTLDLLLRP
ncbi:HAD family phosphatase [Actinomyces sp. 2119]|nr:HAD family phosphatase [Actinomyces sp. 2119]